MKATPELSRRIEDDMYSLCRIIMPVENKV